MRRVRRGLSASVALATLVLLSGCLDFDEQDVVVAYDGTRDQLDAQIVYRGLFSGVDQGWDWFARDSDEEDVEGTERQLDQLLSGRPLFALFNAVFAIDLTRMRRSQDPLAAALADLVTVDVGDAFRSADGRLCAWQHLRIRDVHHAIEVFDAMFRGAVARSSAMYRDALGCRSRVSEVLWNAAVEKKSRWFEEVDGELLWHVPASEGDAAGMAGRISKASTPEEYVAPFVRPRSRVHEASAPATDVVRSPDSVAGSDPYLVLLRAIGATTRRRNGGVDLVLWDRDRKPQALHVPASPEYRKHWDLAPRLAKRKVDVRTDVTDEALRRDFDERRAR